MKGFLNSKKYETITTIVALAGHLASYIQAYKIFSLQSSYAISPSAVFLSLVSVVVWFIFGLTRNIKPLIYANIFGFIGMCLIILGILLYHD